jgi:hypothetical protein
MANAFFGPWYGELGWELLTWQAFCRAEAKKYDKVYVSSFSSMEPLYWDFADEFIPHRHPSGALDWRDISGIDYDMPEGIDVHIEPHKQYKVPNQDFIQFGDEPMRAFVCLIHARNLSKGSSKNYPQGLWEELVAKLPGRVASVGTANDLCVKGTEDLRGIPINALANYMAGSLVVIGQSSGVMHLAALCGTSLVVWGDGRTYFGETLEQRYKETWNPLDAQVEFIFDDKWQPDPQEVLGAVRGLTQTPAVPEIPVEGIKRREVPIKAFEVGGKTIPIELLLDPALAGQKIDVGGGNIIEVPSRVVEVDGKAVLRVPESSEAKEKDVTIRVDSEMAAAMEAAKDSGRWFLAVSYPDPHSSKDDLLHCWQTHNYPREELVRTLEHLKTDVAAKETNPPDVRQRAEETVRVVHPDETKGNFTWK